MKNLYLVLIASLFCIGNLSSCAQETKVVPNYDFNKKYDLNEVMKSYQKVDRPSVDKILEIIKQNTLIGFSWIDTPLGQVTLFKNDDYLCGIRIISFHRNRDKQKATSFDSGSESFSAEYEILIRKNENTSDKEFKIFKGKLTKNATFGIGRLAFGGGDFTLMCGNEKLYWSFPTGISLSNSDTQMKFSPTNANNFKGIDFFNKKNVWYGYDDNREMILLPQNEIQVK